MQVLIGYFDKERCGKISVSEFLSAIRGNMSQSRYKVTEQAFNKLDIDQNGHASKEELKLQFNFGAHPLFQQGIKNKQAILKEFFDNFDGDHDGYIQKDVMRVIRNSSSTTTP